MPETLNEGINKSGKWFSAEKKSWNSQHEAESAAVETFDYLIVEN